jgi:hypothetical protein
MNVLFSAPPLKERHGITQPPELAGEPAAVHVLLRVFKSRPAKMSWSKPFSLSAAVT